MGQWAFSMENILGLNLPWRSLSSHLVTTDKNGNINYMSSFQDIQIRNCSEIILTNVHSKINSGNVLSYNRDRLRASIIFFL